MRAETIARNYAEALFALGEQTGQAAGFGDLIDAVAAAIENAPAVQAVLMSPRVPKQQKTRLLGAALQGAPREFVLFLTAVVKRGRQTLLREIAAQYHALLDLKCDVGILLRHQRHAIGRQGRRRAAGRRVFQHVV